MEIVHDRKRVFILAESYITYATIRRVQPREVTVIRKMAPVNVIVYYPKTEAGSEELARRVSDVHAAAVHQRLKSLNCPTSQKLELLDAVINTARKRSREQTL